MKAPSSSFLLLKGLNKATIRRRAKEEKKGRPHTQLALPEEEKSVCSEEEDTTFCSLLRREKGEGEPKTEHSRERREAGQLKVLSSSSSLYVITGPHRRARRRRKEERGENRKMRLRSLFFLFSAKLRKLTFPFFSFFGELLQRPCFSSSSFFSL